MVTWRVEPDTLQPAFLADIQKLLKSSPYAWTVTSGYRSLQEQQVLWDAFKRGGPRAAPPGKSKHNTGEAVDVVLDGDDAKPGLQPDWNTSHAGWQWLFEAVAAHPRLHSGRSFHDADHLERWSSA